MKNLRYILLSIIFGLASFYSNAQTVYTVTKTTDPDPYVYPYDFDDALCSSEMYGTLQWAIRKSNDTEGSCEIVFNIPDQGPHTINIGYYFPQITNSVSIDGTSQPGYIENEPAIIIDGQNNIATAFYAYNVDGIEISGFRMNRFTSAGVVLYNCINATISSNIISLPNANYNVSKLGFNRIRLMGCNNVSIMNNILNASVEGNPTPGPYNYGIAIFDSDFCYVGGTNENENNEIYDCYTGIYLSNAQRIKISGDLIHDNTMGLLYENGSNNSKKSPIIFSYEEGTINGIGEIGDIIEVFGSTGNENSNEYLGTVQTDENGDWSLSVTTSYDHLIATATDEYGNTSEFSDAILVSSTCTKPTNLSSTEGISTSHTLSWDGPGGVTYNVAVGIEDLNPLDDNWMVNYIQTTDNSVTVSGLDENTEYEFYINANCGTELSYWAGPYSFNFDRDCVSPEITVDIDLSHGAYVGEIEWSPPEPTIGTATAEHYFICQNDEPFFIYDDNPLAPHFASWWCGDCTIWDQEWEDGDVVDNNYYCNEPQIDDDCNFTLTDDPTYGQIIEFDPSQHNPGTYILNAEYELCHLRRVYITILETSDPTILQHEPFCLNDQPDYLSAVTPGGTWSGNGVTPNGIFNPALAGAGQHIITYTLDGPCPATDEITITVFELPNPNVTDQYACIGDDDVVFSTSAEITTATDSYEWEGPNGYGPDSNEWELSIIQANMQGDYTVTVTFDYGEIQCSATASGYLTVYYNPEVSFDSNPVCNGQETSLTANGGIEYNWGDDGTGQTIFINEEGTYTVTVTDENNCTAESSIFVPESNIELQSSIVTNSCDNSNNGSISVNVTGGEIPYIYNWSGSLPDSPDINNLAPGTYYLTVTDEFDCQITDEFIIDASTSPIPEIAGDYVCNGDASGVLTVNVDNLDGPFTYLWSNGEITQTIENLEPGEYTVTVTAENTCSGETIGIVENYNTSAEFHVTEPCLNLDIIGNSYFDPQLVLDEINSDWENYTYEWDLGNGTTSTEPQVLVDYEYYGYYCASIIVSREECVSTTSQTLYVYPKRCFCIEQEWSPGFFEDYVVTETSELWEDQVLDIRGQIIVPSGHSLTLYKCDLVFGTQGGITVHDGGELIVFATKMSSHRDQSCHGPGAMWQGIEVWGKFGMPENGQGRVVFTDSDNIIENAHIGVLLGKRNEDYVCNPDMDPMFVPFNTESSCGIIKASGVTFNNNGTDIKFVRTVNNEQYINPSDVANCTFTCTTLLDPGYLSTYTDSYGPSTSYSGNPLMANPRNPWAAGSNLEQRSPQAIWMQNQRLMVTMNKNTFENKQMCIESYDSRFAVTGSTFDNAFWGIRIFNTINTVNNSHRIEEENYFSNIPGQPGVHGAYIYIRGGILDRIRDNYFGTPGTIQDETNYGIFTLGASRFIIQENDFMRLNTGIRVSSSGPQTSDIRAGESEAHDDWRGNYFTQCDKNIFTTSDNSGLRLKCNNCYNITGSMYTVNFRNSGTLGDQGFYPGGTPQQTWGAGNEFFDGVNPMNPSVESRYLYTSTNNTYNYVHHNDVRTTPTLHPDSDIITMQPLGFDKDENPIACPVVSDPWIIPFTNDDPDTELPPVEDIIPIRPDILDLIENLEYDLEQAGNNKDNGITYELLSDIEQGMPNGQLKNKLVASSPLSDTVIIALLIDYPLSHGNFKNVMEMNLPVSKNVEPYFYARSETLPEGISRQLLALQAYNPNTLTETAIQRQINYWSRERELLVNRILILLTDSAYYRPDYISEILIAENDPYFTRTYVANLISEGDFTEAQQIINTIDTVDKETSDWIEYHEILLSLYEQGKTIYDMDSAQLDFIREKAYECPPDYTTANAQSVLYILYGIEVPECVEMQNRNMSSLVKDIEFTVPETGAWIEDNFPNPFTKETLVNYYLPEGMQGRVIVNDMYGKLIDIYDLNEGENTLKIISDDWAPGIYNYGFMVEDKIIEYKKMVITQ